VQDNGVHLDGRRRASSENKRGEMIVKTYLSSGNESSPAPCKQLKQ
jgi:hypothetical protein